MMKNLYLKKAMKTKIIIFLIVLISLNTNIVFAENDKYLELKETLLPYTESLRSRISAEPLVNCIDIVSPLFDMATLEFLQFLDSHYSNKASTSSLNNIALNKYMLYRRYIKEVVSKLYSNTDGVSQTDLMQEYQSFKLCESLGDSYIELSKKKMYEYVRTNVYVKKSTIVNEMMVPLNEEMRELSFSYTKMYASFLTFRDKLPGFLTNCVTK